MHNKNTPWRAALLVCALVLPPLALGQVRVEYLGGDQAAAIESRRVAIEIELRARGHVAGRDFVLNGRTFEGDKTRLRALAAQIVREKPSIIYAGSWDAADELRKYTEEIPIVFAARTNLDSPVFRIVDNLRNPERNLTGFTRYVNLIPKKLQLLKEAFPSVKQVGFVYGNDIRPERQREYQDASSKLGIEMKFRRFEKGDLSNLSDKLNRLEDEVFLVAADDLLTYNRMAYVEQLARLKKPVIHPEAATDKGVLMHYVAIMDGEAKAAEYISKLLRGAKVRDLAVQEPQEFDFSVNVTTLRRNGLTMSRDVLARARKVE